MKTVLLLAVVVLTVIANANACPAGEDWIVQAGSEKHKPGDKFTIGETGISCESKLEARKKLRQKVQKVYVTCKFPEKHSVTFFSQWVLDGSLDVEIYERTMATVDGNILSIWCG